MKQTQRKPMMLLLLIFCTYSFRLATRKRRSPTSTDAVQLNNLTDLEVTKPTDNCEQESVVVPAVDEKFLIVERHGESVGNILSQNIKAHFKRLSKFERSALRPFFEDLARLGWNIIKRRAPPNLFKGGAVHDSPLSLVGLAEMRRVGQAMFGEDMSQDPFEIFPDGTKVTVMFSPMRRTISTAILSYGIPVQKRFKRFPYLQDNIKFRAMPFAHEKVTSLSDMGMGKAFLANYVFEEWDANEGKGAGRNSWVAKQMHKSLEDIDTEHGDDWFKTYYKQDGQKPFKEEEEYFQKRMSSLKKAILEDDSQRVILVTHSKVIQELFADLFSQPEFANLKPANGGVLAGDLTGVLAGSWHMKVDPAEPRDAKAKAKKRFPWSKDTDDASHIPFVMEDYKKVKADKPKTAGKSRCLPFCK